VPGGNAFLSSYFVGDSRNSRLGAMKMNGTISRFSRVGAGLLAVLSLAFVMSGQGVRAQGADGRSAAPHISGFPHDWSQRHVVFSNPGTEEQAIQDGRYTDWLKIVNDPRYKIQQMLRDPEARRAAGIGSAPGAVSAGEPDLEVSQSLGFDPAAKKKPQPGLSKDWSESLGAGIVLPNTYPAKYSFVTTSSSCATDYVTYPTGTAGSGTTQATIVAYFNLYAGTGGCTGTVPQVYWSYNTAFPQGSSTGDGSKITTSPTLSFDDNGAQVVFIQVNSTGVASLVVLKWAQSATTVALSTGTNNVIPANYRSCVAPCMTRIPLNGSPNVTWSQPYYDYAYDLLYVGDNAGKLHQFSGVFNGTPQETLTGFPVTLSTVDLAAPVYDPISTCVLVGDTNGVLYSVNSGNAGGTVCTGTAGALEGKSETLGNGGTGTEGIFDAPLVDGNAGTAYAFVTDSAHISGCAAGTNCVYQYLISNLTTTGVAPNGEESLGTGAASDYLFSGFFDNVYFESGPDAGHIYAVGNTGAKGAVLYQIPINGSGVMTTPVSEGTISSTASGTYLGWGSPVAEFCNNGTSACVSNGTATTSGTDYIFLSVYRGTNGGCTTTASNGCILSYTVSYPTSIGPETTTVCTPSFLSSCSSNTFTSTHGNFTAADIGRPVTDSLGIFPAGTTITGYTSGTPDTITLSASYSNSYFNFTETDNVTMPGVSAAGTNQNQATYGNPGCYVSGGFIVDNSVALSGGGASQIYFITLDSAATNVCGAAGSGKMSGVQTSQAAP
jgi:hypothetical protein